jgi:hypothetical protein
MLLCASASCWWMFCIWICFLNMLWAFFIWWKQPGRREKDYFYYYYYFGT